MTKSKTQKKRAQKPNPPKNKNRSHPKKQKSNRGRLLKELGTGIGTVLGMPSIGSAVGSGLSRVFGQGDYKVSTNTFLTKGVPSFGSLDTPMRFKHREYLGTVNTSTTYGVQQSIHLNPGLLAPVISQIADSFTMYKFHGLMFIFNSTSGTSVASTNTALGVTGMVCNYDPDAPVFPTRQAAEEYVGCQSAVPSNNLYLPIECKSQTTMLERRFVRFGQTNKPLAETDLGVFQFFADGAQAASVAGELWVCYDVEFYLPQITSVSAGTLAGITDTIYSNADGSGLTGWSAVQEQRLLQSPTSTGATIINPGAYMIQLTLTTATTISGSLVIVGSGFETLSEFEGVQTPDGGASSVAKTGLWFLYFNNAVTPFTFTLGGASIGGITFTGGSLAVTLLPSSYNPTLLNRSSALELRIAKLEAKILTLTGDFEHVGGSDHDQIQIRKKVE
jgi:hypothetical protein